MLSLCDHSQLAGMTRVESEKSFKDFMEYMDSVDVKVTKQKIGNTLHEESLVKCTD